MTYSKAIYNVYAFLSRDYWEKHIRWLKTLENPLGGCWKGFDDTFSLVNMYTMYTTCKWKPCTTASSYRYLWERRKLKPYPKAAFTTGLSSSFFFWYSSCWCCSCSCLKLLVVWRLFLNAVTVATVPRALSSTLTVQALDTSSTPSKRRPERVRHLQSRGRNIESWGSQIN